MLEPSVKSLIVGDSEPFETGAMPRLVAGNELAAFHHTGFWQPMDTLRERNELKMYASAETPPWLVGLE